MNVSQGKYLAAFLTGGLLSVIWWGNSKTAAHSTARGAQWLYGFGAACGTVCGMAIGRYLS